MYRYSNTVYILMISQRTVTPKGTELNWQTGALIVMQCLIRLEVNYHI